MHGEEKSQTNDDFTRLRLESMTGGPVAELMIQHLPDMADFVHALWENERETYESMDAFDGILSPYGLMSEFKYKVLAPALDHESRDLPRLRQCVDFMIAVARLDDRPDGIYREATYIHCFERLPDVQADWLVQQFPELKLIMSDDEWHTQNPWYRAARASSDGRSI